MNLAWMAWTWPTAAFFLVIAAALVGMTVWHVVRPSYPRVGVLRIPTTRGDRLFISLLGSAYIQLGWLILVGPPLWGALAVAIVFAVLVFRFV